jgi:hypothetical protein
LNCIEARDYVNRAKYISLSPLTLKLVDDFDPGYSFVDIHLNRHLVTSEKKTRLLPLLPLQYFPIIWVSDTPPHGEAQMSIGSKRITIRIGDELNAMVSDAVERRNNGSNQSKHWTTSEYIIQAIVEKLNHDNRSKGDDTKIRQLLVCENEAREVWEE